MDPPIFQFMLIAPHPIIGHHIVILRHTDAWPCTMPCGSVDTAWMSPSAFLLPHSCALSRACQDQGSTMLPHPTQRSGGGEVSSVHVYSGISPLEDVCKMSLDEVICNWEVILEVPKTSSSNAAGLCQGSQHTPLPWILAYALQVHILALGVNFSFLGQLCVVAMRSDSKSACSH